VVADLGTSLGALVLVLGFPVVLLVGLWALGRLEAWMLQPEEHAAEIKRLLEREDEADDVEAAVTRLVAGVADPQAERLRQRSMSGSSG